MSRRQKLRLVIAASSQSFDQRVIGDWEAEGFDVRFEPVRDGTRASMRSIGSIADSLEIGEKYAIIAYGPAATLLLRTTLFEALPKLCALVAFYPTSLPDPTGTARQTSNQQIHLAGSQLFGGSYRTYHYPRTQPGFAQHESGVYDSNAANLAWSRALECVRFGFGIRGNIEDFVIDWNNLKTNMRDVESVPKVVSSDAHVLNIPTLSGGAGTRRLEKFYEAFFKSPGISYTLISRTVGSDRVVDEMIVSFTHSQTMDWILPGVPPTGKKVEIPLVSIICVRGNKLVHEHAYWDQASVLVQIGVLDAKIGAVGLGKNGLNSLPINGVTQASHLRESSIRENNGIFRPEAGGY